jgi:hypothetical protein
VLEGKIKPGDSIAIQKDGEKLGFVIVHSNEQSDPPRELTHSANIGGTASVSSDFSRRRSRARNHGADRAAPSGIEWRALKPRRAFLRKKNAIPTRFMRQKF